LALPIDLSTGERLGLRQMLVEPEFLAAVEADVDLVADLVSLRAVMPEKTKSVAREVVAKVVRELMERLEQRTAEASAAPSTAPAAASGRHRLAAHDPRQSAQLPA